MKTTFTQKKFTLRKERWSAILILAVFLLVGCYEWFTINQPTEAYNNDSFEVQLVAKDDSTDGAYWALELRGYGLFGVLLPEGWTVNDSIHYNIVARDSALNQDYVLVAADQDYSNDGYLIYNEAQSQLLTDSIGAPDGYYWWGAKTDQEAMMDFFDSLYFTVTINTDEQVGTFYLQYAIGDDENAEMQREPADDVSDPIAIEITENPATTGIETMFADIEFAMYPNPTKDLLNINFDDFTYEVVHLTMINSVGKTMLTQDLREAKNTIDLSSYQQGIYFIRLQKGNDIASLKIILE